MKKPLHFLLLFTTIFLFAIVINGCPRPLPPPVPPTPTFPDASTLDHPATCADVCQRLFLLGCPAANPTSAGATCLDVCTNITSAGVITWNLECMAMATSCANVDACN